MTRALLDFRVDVGGLGRYGHSLIDALAEIDDAPDIVAVTLPGSRLDRLRLAPFTPWGRQRVGALARRDDVQLVHGLHLEIPAGFPTRVVTIHDVIPLRHPSAMPGRMRQRVFERILRTSLTSALAVITPSELTAADLLDRGADPAKVVVVPNGIDESWHVDLDEDARAGARARFGGGSPYVATVAAAGAHKNIPVMAGVAELLGAQADITVAIAGSPALTPGGAVHAVGRLRDDELRIFYGGAEVLVLPSVVEGFGYPALEAAAAGVPVVCGRDVGVRPYLGDGVIAVDVRDPGAIAEAVISLVTDDGARARVSRAAAAAARALTGHRMARSTADVYRTVLEAL